MKRRVLRITCLLLVGTLATAAWAASPASSAGDATPRPLELPAEATSALATAGPGVGATVRGWPVAPGRLADVVLTRHEVYAPGAETLVVEGGATSSALRSGWRFFWGAVVDDASTRVMVALDAADVVVLALSVTPEGTFEIRPTAVAGVHEIVDAEAAAEAAGAGPWTCGQEELPGDVPVVAPFPGESRDHLATLHGVTVAVDTDTELLSLKFGNNTTSATNYIASLFAGMNAMYETDLNIRLLVGTTYLRVGTDPWSQLGDPNVTGAQLDEFANYWIANYSGVTRGLAALLSGKQASGASGMAWYGPGVLCSTTYGYSFSQVYRTNNLAGDLQIVPHEIGHNFGSPHTHCYVPPIDQCYSGASGCYSGGTSCPGGPGTIMSYCHLLGCGNNLMQFGSTVVAYLDPIIAARVGICVAPLGGGTDTVGIFRTSDRQWYLRNSNSAGNADVVFPYGDPAIDVPIVGDWNGDGVDTVGIYRSGTFYLRNSNTGGNADIVVAFGDPGGTDIPVAGDWNGDGTDTIGIYRPSTGTWFLRNTNAAGAPDLSFAYGLVNETPVVGDWNNDGVDTVGIFRASDRQWYLRNSNSGGNAEIVFPYGDPATDVPVVGDWNGDGTDTVGVYRPASGTWFLRNSNSGGFADLSFSYGILNEKPVVGDWNGQ